MLDEFELPTSRTSFQPKARRPKNFATKRGAVERNISTAIKPETKKVSTAPRENESPAFMENAKNARRRKTDIQATISSRNAVNRVRNRRPLSTMRMLPQKSTATKTAVPAKAAAAPLLPSATIE